jgi:hypothetical protein
MVKTAAQAAAKYKAGIEAFGGAAQYIECGKKKGEGFLAVAECLESAKATKLTTDLMVSKYKAAARVTAV